MMMSFYSEILLYWYCLPIIIFMYFIAVTSYLYVINERFTLECRYKIEPNEKKRTFFKTDHGEDSIFT